MKSPNQSAAANGLSAVRSSVAGVRERTVRSTAAAEAVAELGRSAEAAMDAWLLTIAIACAVPYGLLVVVLLFRNASNLRAWLFAVLLLGLWPSLFFTSLMQLVVVVPMTTVFAMNGCDIRKPLPARVGVAAVGATVGIMGSMAAIAILHDA